MYRLSEATVVEPLVNQWPVWPQLISPVTASLQLLKHQLPTLRSYLEDPESHARLARDPEFAGSPFSDIPPHRVEEVRALLASTEQKLKKNLDFARAVSEFHNQFVAEAHGQSLESFYEELPDEMRGYVELFYDYYHHPGVRFLEGLLYESEYYDPSLQSLRIFQVARDNARPFFMSTPRLIDEGQIDWRIPFAAPAVDQLFHLDLEPQPLAAIREILNLKSDDERYLLPLLTEGGTSASPKWREQQLRIRYFGHACVLIEWNGVSILTDPYIPVMPVAGGLARYSYRDLPEKIDYALVTHSHQDHFALETLLRLRQRIGCLVVPKSYGLLCGDISLKLMARKMNFRQVMELDTLESISLPEGEIVGVPFMGEHGDLAHGKMAYVVRAG
ncbi:MAG TPA: MBL fold metallo-hydrolase, partial [Pyrinomonadaceae bacterium]